MKWLSAGAITLLTFTANAGDLSPQAERRIDRATEEARACLARVAAGINAGVYHDSMTVNAQVTDCEFELLRALDASTDLAVDKAVVREAAHSAVREWIDYGILTSAVLVSGDTHSGRAYLDRSSVRRVKIGAVNAQAFDLIVILSPPFPTNPTTKGYAMQCGGPGYWGHDADGYFPITGIPRDGEVDNIVCEHDGQRRAP
jgi:hypothetical protein